MSQDHLSGLAMIVIILLLTIKKYAPISKSQTIPNVVDVFDASLLSREFGEAN